MPKNATTSREEEGSEIEVGYFSALMHMIKE